jgi:hypothetical protein
MTKTSNKYKFYNFGPFLIALSWSDKNLWNLTSDKGENYKMLFAFNYVTFNNEEDLEKFGLYARAFQIIFLRLLVMVTRV